MDIPVTAEQIRTFAFYLWEKDGARKVGRRNTGRKHGSG
nr:DUF2934 domain-containing protein [Paraburkholderia hospita]